MANNPIEGAPIMISGRGGFVFAVDGDFNGATIKLQLESPIAGNWLDIPDAAFTAPGAVVVLLAPGNRVRVTNVGTPGANIAASFS